MLQGKSLSLAVVSHCWAPMLHMALVTGLCCVIIRICTPSYTCAICFLPLYSARYNGKSVSSTASKSDWFISAFADLWHGVGLNRLVLPSESRCPSIRTSVPYLGLRRCTVGPLTLYRNTIYCISFLIIPQYNVFVNQITDFCINILCFQELSNALRTISCI